MIDDEGNQVGMMKTPDAVKFAQERDLDLVEVAPEAKPPVCRVLDYSKYKYEQAQKVKQARKHQQQITIREIKFRPKIAQHDYDTKKHHVERFLRHKDKVKITIMFRGREVTHPERGVMILDRLAEELAELCIVEQRPTQDGRNMTMMLGPSKAVLAGKADGPDGSAGAPEVPPDGSVVAGENVSSDGSVGIADAKATSDGAVESPAVESPEAEATPDGAVESPEAEAASDGRVESGAVDASPDGEAPVAEVAAAPDGGSDGSVS